jgi:hypothetical protein
VNPPRLLVCFPVGRYWIWPLSLGEVSAVHADALRGFVGGNGVTVRWGFMGFVACFKDHILFLKMKQSVAWWVSAN